MTKSATTGAIAAPATAPGVAPTGDWTQERARAALTSVIILTDHSWINGGQSKVAIESALQLKARGLNVCYVAGLGPPDDRLLAAGIECHLVGGTSIRTDRNRLRAAAKGIWDVAAARLVRKCIGARDPRSTVVHVHGWAHGLSPSVGPAVTCSEAAHVYTMHDYFLACPNGGFYDYGAGQICTRSPLGMQCLAARCDSRAHAHKLWRVARQAVLRTAGRLPQNLREIIYLAPEQRSIMAPFMPEEARWHYLPNATGPRPSRRVSVERNEAFLFIGRLSREKGAEVAARAARLAGVPIAFCGDGESAEAVRRANPEAQMLGWLAEEELQSLMSRARCLVFPSLWYECNPLVVADALRIGLPIIVSTNSIAAASVSHGGSGLHVRAGDVEGLADAMTQLLSNERARDMSRAAFAAGAALLTYDEYIPRLIEIYRGAIDRKHGAAGERRTLA